MRKAVLSRVDCRGVGRAAWIRTLRRENEKERAFENSGIWDFVHVPLNPRLLLPASSLPPAQQFRKRRAMPVDRLGADE
jgi:hypothetical protein